MRFLIIILFLVSCSHKVKISGAKVRKCIGEQIEIARENWDTVRPTRVDSVEFVAQDQLRDFIIDYCLEENQ